jgi:hypothetical protein
MESQNQKYKNKIAGCSQVQTLMAHFLGLKIF